MGRKTCLGAVGIAFFSQCALIVGPEPDFLCHIVWCSDNERGCALMAEGPCCPLLAALEEEHLL